jgi:N-acetylmuramoyl-L-alanine amidase
MKNEHHEQHSTRANGLREQLPTHRESMTGSIFFSRAVGVVAGLARPSGVPALAAVWLTLAPPPVQYFGSRADAAIVQPGPAGRPVANAVSLEHRGNRAKLIFDLSAPVDVTAFVLAGPDRVIVDLPQTDFSLDPEAGKPAHRQRRKTSLIASFRFGQLEPGKSRIVIGLGAKARIVRAACEPKYNDGRTRLVIELVKTDRASFRNAVLAARLQLAALTQGKKPQEPKVASTKPVVVLDPGHGGIDRGAMVKGLIEKELVFAFAKAVAQKLEDNGHVKVVMTREDDSFVPLSERVRMARDGNAGLFVSIHADTLSEAANVSGATIYTLSDRASDAESARVAEKENQADVAAGYDKSDDAGDVMDILFDLTRRETRAYSHLFAHTLVDYWRAAGRLNRNPRRSAGFRVLTAPDVPSVLLELGYLSNSKDSQTLNSPQWREQASSQVAEAIEAFFSARGSNATVNKTDSEPVHLGKIPSTVP